MCCVRDFSACCVCVCACVCVCVCVCVRVCVCVCDFGMSVISACAVFL